MRRWRRGRRGGGGTVEPVSLKNVLDEVIKKLTCNAFVVFKKITYIVNVSWF